MSSTLYIPVKIVESGHPLGWDATQHLYPKLTCNHHIEYLCYLSKDVNLHAETNILSFFSASHC